MEGRSTESLIRSVRSFLSIKSAARSTRNLQKSGKESEDSSANNNGEGNSNSDMGTRAWWRQLAPNGESSAERDMEMGQDNKKIDGGISVKKTFATEVRW